MTVTIELPPPLDERLADAARRDGVPLEEEAALLLVLAHALLTKEAPTPFQEAVQGFLARHALNPEEVASAFWELVGLSAALHDRGRLAHPFQDALHDPDARRDLTLLVHWRNQL